jgi:pantothenate kinase
MALLDSASSPDPTASANSRVDAILAALQKRPAAYLVAIAGIPGSGKSTLCEALLRRRPDAVVIPMDGCHIPRSQLDAEGIRRRGAPFTFDVASFRADLLRLKQTRAGLFPAFDHAEKDPRPNAIEVTPSVPLIIVEGNYLLMQEWRLEPLFDLRVFLDCDLDTAMERVALRHLACGISQTEEEARYRASTNDRLNALEILADGCRDRADLILPG